MRFSTLSSCLLAVFSTALASPTLVDRGLCATLPKNIPVTIDAALPDPFKSLDGKRVTTKTEWECRRAQIGSLLLLEELGTLPPAPEHLTTSLVNGTLTINATHAGNTISFSPTIQYPATGRGPFPAIIALGGASIPIPDGVAVITFDNSEIAEQTDQTSRGVGKFFDLYGTDDGAGAMIAWVWAISRIIDSLEITARTNNIKLDRLGVTGCSRNGKGALVAGAFEERIALTIPQESGSGGDGCWRISDVMLAAGEDTQTAGEIVQENVWFSTNFDQFSTNVTSLPFDHHMLAGMVAPRALFVIENSDNLWLGPESGFGCMSAAQTVWQALDIPELMGYSIQGNHSHCDFPASQQPDLDAFISRFLLDQPADTSVFKTNGNGNMSFVWADWVNWEVPHLKVL